MVKGFCENGNGHNRCNLELRGWLRLKLELNKNAICRHDSLTHVHEIMWQGYDQQ